MAAKVIEVPEEFEKELIELNHKRSEAKYYEDKSKAERIKYQDLIMKNKFIIESLAAKGTNNLSCGIKVVTGYTEEWDIDYLKSIDIPDNLKPFNIREEKKIVEVLEVSNDGLDYLKENEPHIYNIVIKGLTTKPKAPQFK